METQQTRFRVEVKHPDETKEYLLKLDSKTPTAKASTIRDCEQRKL